MASIPLYRFCFFLVGREFYHAVVAQEYVAMHSLSMPPFLRSCSTLQGILTNQSSALPLFFAKGG
jgi:hypothetical protein